MPTSWRTMPTVVLPTLLATRAADTPAAMSRSPCLWCSRAVVWSRRIEVGGCNGRQVQWFAPLSNVCLPCAERGSELPASPTPMFSVLLATGLQHTLMMQQWINTHGTDPCKCCSSSRTILYSPVTFCGQPSASKEPQRPASHHARPLTYRLSPCADGATY